MGVSSDKPNSTLSNNPIGPALLTALVMTLVVVVFIGRGGGDPLALARLGTQFNDLDPAGSEGYDGQFVYYIARDLDPTIVQKHLDIPAYRYQRILLPLLARLVSLGDAGIIPWAIPFIGIFAQALGTWFVGSMLVGWGRSPWYALIYGLWVGFTLAIRLDLPEPLAYGLVAGAIFTTTRRHVHLAWVLYALAIFAKEVTAIFVVAQMFADASQKRWRDVIGLAGVAFLPYLGFQLWLGWVFGEFGIGSGGAYATPFEWIPFMGFLRVGQVNLTLLGIYVIVFGPTVLLPAIWGIWEGARQFGKRRDRVITAGLLINAIVIPFLPFSTFREPGGLLRFTCGLILALLLYAGRHDITRLLRYGWFSLVLNVFLIE